MAEARGVFAQVTDASGQESSEWVGVQEFGAGEVYRLTLDDGTSMVFIGDELRDALFPRREVRAA